MPLCLTSIRPDLGESPSTSRIFINKHQYDRSFIDKQTGKHLSLLIYLERGRAHCHVLIAAVTTFSFSVAEIVDMDTLLVLAMPFVVFTSFHGSSASEIANSQSVSMFQDI